MNTSAVQAAFAEAARTLGFSFDQDFVVGHHRSVGLVHGFGAAHGTLIFGVDDHPDPPVLEQLRIAGYFSSLLTETYEDFDEELFRGTLDDWGYFGPEHDKPSWYTGKAWR